MNKPLKGIQVLDLTKLLPGPMCTLHLADLGADVIKIEDPKNGDLARKVPPLAKETSTFFHCINRHKRSVALDLTTEVGKQHFLQLVHSADLVVEGFRPGVVKKLGIDYEVLKTIRPDIIYCSISGYGQTGPYKNKAGHDLNYSGYAGIINTDTLAGDRPVIPKFQIADMVGGTLNAAMGILSALFDRERTGKGCYIDVSILDGVLAHNVTEFSGLGEVGEEKLTTTKMLSGSTPSYNLYKTQDAKYMALGAIEFKFWKLFCETIERPDLIDTHLAHGERGDQVLKIISEIVLGKTRKDWEAIFADVDCCFTPVLEGKEVMYNDQIQARKMVVSHTHPTEGELIQLSLPLKFSNEPFDIINSAPMLGAHNSEILQNLNTQEH